MEVFVSKVNKDALMEFFMDNGLVNNYQYIPYERRSEIFQISEAMGGGLNVAIYPCRKTGVICKNAFADCYLLTDMKIYQQQDEFTAKDLKTLNRKYKEFMYDQSKEYMALRQSKQISKDKDAEKFYGDINQF